MTRAHKSLVALATYNDEALDKLVLDLGSLEDAINVVRTFAATLSWRASRIQRTILDGSPQYATSIMQDLRNGAVMVGALPLAQWCRLAIAAPEGATDPDEITDLAATTHDWLERWMDANEPDVV